MEHEPVHIIGEIGEGQFRLGPRQADPANEQPIAVLLMGEDMLHMGTDARGHGEAVYKAVSTVDRNVQFVAEGRDRDHRQGRSVRAVADLAADLQ